MSEIPNSVTPSGYPLPWCNNRTEYPEPTDSYMWDHAFTAADYTLAYALDVDDNLQAEAIVAAAVAAADEGRFEGVIQFESEFGCFVAHSDNEADIIALAAIVAALVAAVHPAAIPGGITCSPAWSTDTTSYVRETHCSRTHDLDQSV